MRATRLPPRALLPRAQWIELGVSARRLRGPELQSPLTGFHTPAAYPASLDRILAVLQQEILPDAVASHSTAALLHGIPMPWWLDGGVCRLGEPDATGRLPAPVPSRLPGAESPSPPPPIHCRVPGDSRRQAGEFVTVHRMPPARTITVRGLRVSHPVVCLVELASVLPHDDLVIALDHLLGPRSRYRGLDVARIEERLDECRGAHGVPAVRAALRDARPGVESPGETRARLLVMRAGFPEPVPNLPVLDPDTGTMRRLDLAWEGALIGAEYDGDYHRRGRDKDRRGISQWRADHARRESLVSLGWTLPFLNADDIAAPGRFLSTLRRAFVSRGLDAPPESRWSGRAGRDLARTSRPPAGSPGGDRMRYGA